MAGKILIIGFGYTGQYLSHMLIEHNMIVSATTRSPAKIKKFNSSPVRLILLDEEKLNINISGYDFILISVPPSCDGQDVVINTLKEQLVELKSDIKWIGYLSSTSVYGDHKGGWVDENSKPIALCDRGLRRLKVESQWMSLFDEFNLPVHIFRLAAIYGPGRNSLTRILNGRNTVVVKEGQVFSRIHIKDICRSLYESMKKPTPGEVYNLADDFPSSSQNVDEYAAQLLHKPPLIKLPLDEADLSVAAKEFYQSSRRVSNKKFKKVFEFQLCYPSCREGLKSLCRSL